MTIEVISSDNPEGDPRVRRLLDLLRSGSLTAAGEEGGLDIGRIVAGIIDRVSREGDRALVDLEHELDGARLTPESLRVPEEKLREAHEAAEPEFIGLIGRAAANIREYQQSILLHDPPPLRRGGRTLGVRYRPVRRAAVYAPGGRAFYPSTVLMTAVPASVAGVPEIVIASPPTSDGEVHPMVLAMSWELGFTEVYRMGGAQALAALALGTSAVRAVDKIAGPGNAFVAEAKRQLFGRVGIDIIAGPSEVLIVADETADPEWTAMDMLSQAEHDPGSAVLVTTSEDLARRTLEAVERRLPQMSRSRALAKALREYSAIIVTPDLETACRTADAFAPEHLQVVTRDAEDAAERISNAGAVFIGPHTPVPVGDYYAGPSHVLPTGSTARFFGPLSCNDFLKASSTARYEPASLEEDAADIIDFAEREGLTAHAEAVRLRTRG